MSVTFKYLRGVGYSLALAVIIASCSKQESAFSALVGPTGPPNTVYTATTNFVKSYYLQDFDTKAEIVTTISNSLGLIPDGIPVVVGLSKDPTFTKPSFQIDTLITQNGVLTSSIILDFFPNTSLTLYVKMQFPDGSVLGSYAAETYKLPEFHNFTQFYAQNSTSSFISSTYPFGVGEITAFFSGLQNYLPQGVYQLDYLVVQENVTNLNKNSTTITVDSSGNATADLEVDLFYGDFYFKFAIPYQNDYVWIPDSKILTID